MHYIYFSLVKFTTNSTQWFLEALVDTREWNATSLIFFHATHWVKIAYYWVLIFLIVIVQHNRVASTKAELAKEGTLFANIFPSLRTFVNKKVGIWKNKAHLVYNF